METVATAHDYFDKVVGYNAQQYKAQPSSLPAAFNLAICLFHMHDWMWHTYGSVLGDGINGPKKYNEYVQTQCSSYKYMRDLANASKHVVLVKSPSTNARQITDTSSIESRYGEGPYGVSKYGRGVVIINDGGTIIDFENAADNVIEYWKNAIGRMG